jgi:hypothetical protein
MLQAQCELWSGPIAAVAYMPLVKGRLVSMDDAALNGTTVEESKAKLAAFYEAVTHAGRTTHASCIHRSTCIQGLDAGEMVPAGVQLHVNQVDILQSSPKTLQRLHLSGWPS